MLDAFLSYLGPFGAALAGVAGVETALNGALLWGASAEPQNVAPAAGPYLH